jgi:site-specific recombinase XerD
MLQATRDIRKVALLLGHSDMRTTEIYLRVEPSCAENIDHAAGGQPAA